MAEEALILANNLQHNVLMPRTHGPQLSLIALPE
jgi:hypothetical protein